MKASGYANNSATDKLKPFEFDRREPGPQDVVIDILYCGVCHSDIHSARNEWGHTHYPFVPGHEIIGRVRAVGNKVSRFKAGELVGVGCLVDCGFRPMPAPDSGACRAAVPVDAGPVFRPMPG